MKSENMLDMDLFIQTSLLYSPMHQIHYNYFYINIQKPYLSIDKEFSFLLSVFSYNSISFKNPITVNNAELLKTPIVPITAQIVLFIVIHILYNNSLLHVSLNLYIVS